MLDWIIRNATIIDGSKQPRYQADIGLQGDRIAVIGELKSETAAQTVDATGKVAAPGFIDVHTHTDGHLLGSPGLEAKLSQGFTTEMLMLDGISYAPVNEHNWRDWFIYLRALDGLSLDQYTGWRSLAEYMTLLDRRAVQNSVALVPYANVRALACGFGKVACDDYQLQSISYEIDQCMQAGAVGLSTGLDYIAQCHATTDELVRACEATRPYRGVYVTHIRYKRGVMRGLQEALEIGRRAGVAVHISHLKIGTQGAVEEIFEFLDAARGEIEITFDVYPYQSGSTMLNYMLPYDVWQDGPLAALSKLADPHVRQRFADGLPWYRLTLEHIRVAWVLTASNKHLQGMTLAEIVEQRGGAAADVLCDLLIEERLAVLLVLEETDDTLVHPFLAHDLYMMGSDGIYFEDGHLHPRVFGSAARLLGPLVRDVRLFSLEDAVYKLSAFAAERFGLHQRGILREGYFADLVLFDPERITDCATYATPRQMSVGVEKVWVNGELAFDGQKVLWPKEGPRCGRWLRAGRA